jgi:tetratricopeptide (TPR) repeat protein
VPILSNKEKLLASAQKFLQKGQLARAIKDYQKLLELEPRDVRIRQKLAELYSRDRRTEEALEAYEAVAKHYTESGFYLKSIAVYKQMQKIEPTRTSIYHRLAELNEKQGLIGNALSEYRSLVAYYEKNAMLPEAIKVLQKMKELEPENLNLRVKVAETYAQEGLKEKAREEILEILGQLREKQDFARILKLYDLFLPHFPGDLELQTGQARALLEQGETERALESLKGLLRQDPDNAAILPVLALCYRKKGEFENERLTYQHLLKIAPEDLGFREGHILASLDQGDFPRALKELEEWKEAFLAAGKGELLTKFYERLGASGSDDPQATKTLHSLYAARGEGTQLFNLLPAMPAEGEVSAAETTVPAAEASLDEASREEATAAMEEPEGVAEVAPEPPAEPEEEPAEAHGEHAAAEIPLAFLEGVGEGVSDETVSPELVSAAPSAGMEPPAAAEVGEEAAGEAEREIELELDLDLDLDLVEEPFAGEEMAAGPAQAESEATPPAEPAEELEPLEVAEELESLEVAEELESLEVAEELESLEPADELEVELEVADELVLEDELGLEPMAEEAAEDLLVLDDEVDLAPALAEPAEEIAFPREQEPESAAALGEQAVAAELEEAEFYLQQGLFDAAERVLNDLLAMAPACPQALAKLAEVGAARTRTAAAGAPPAPAYVDLTEALLGDVESALDRAGAEEAGAFHFDEEFAAAAGAESGQIDVEDAESHYNLGIAYKEMGLIDEAIAEFDKAVHNPARALDAMTLKGICLLEKGLHADAEELFLAALDRLSLSAAEAAGLRFELGLLYQSWGRPQQALEAFEAVAATDPFYREVGVKIAALREKLGLGDGNDEDAGQKAGKKDRVSFV